MLKCRVGCSTSLDLTIFPFDEKFFVKSKGHHHHHYHHLCFIMEQKNTRNKKMEETCPNFEKWRRTWAVLPLSSKQLKLLMVSSNTSSVELDDRVSQQFLPKDYYKCKFPLYTKLPSCKRESFPLVLPSASHGKESERNRAGYLLRDFQGTII